MKKIVNFSIVSAFLLGLIFPGGMVLGGQNVNILSRQNNMPAPAPKILISVSIASPLGKVVVNDSPAAVFAANCTGTLGASGNILQDAGLINLNQPAGCFSLKVSRQNFETAKLSVMPLSRPAVNVVVAYNGPVISSPDLSQVPVLPQTPVLPVVALGLIISLAATSGKIIFRVFRVIKAGALSAKQALTLQQLQMLRC